jgi:demethylmenaquinone methyltransferase/2-methoxy-6-polyprenyl-1,4-benzoquinol methylase
MPGKYPSLDSVTDAQRVGMVKDIFSTVTAKYDFLNRLFSLRRDLFWRRSAVRKMKFFRTWRFIDVATGTSDLAIEAALRYKDIDIAGLDFVQNMLDFAKKKIYAKALSSRISLLRANALSMPFPSEYFDVAGIAFGIRNIPEKISMLKEMTRVVVPGGQVMILEMNFPQNILFRGVYNIYLNIILPFIARAFSPNPQAYNYLGESILNFPSPYEFAEIMERSGLTGIKIYPLTFGITHLFTGYKPGA